MNQPEGTAQPLSENHARVIAITLRLMEKELDQIEMYINMGARGRMYIIIDDLSQNTREILLERIKMLRECIWELADLLQLQPERTSLTGFIRGTISSCWVNICDIEPKRLKAYGAVDPDIASTLDHYTAKLIKLINSIRT